MRPQATATSPCNRPSGSCRARRVVGFLGAVAAICWTAARPASAAGGAAWQGIGPSGGSVYSFVVDPASPRTVYAAGAWDLFKTIDGGATWQRSDTGLLPGPIAAVVIDPRSPARLYAAAGSEGAVFTSADGGASWARAGRAGSFPLSCLAIDPQSPGILYAGSIYTGMARSTDGGKTWVSIDNGLSSLQVDSVTVDPRHPATVYAGTSAGVFKSVNRGATWQAASKGMSSPAPAVEAITVDPLEEGVVYAATFASFTPGGGVGGLYVSRNGGATWRLLPVPVPPNDPLGVTCLLISPAPGRPLYACAGGVAVSTNGGRTWQRLDGGLGTAFIGSLALDPSDPRRLYAGVTMTANIGPAIYRTEDGGALWQPAGAGITAISSTALAALGGPAGSVLLGTAGAGVLRTTDDGAQWSPANSGLRGIDVLALAAPPQAPATAYIETNRAFFASAAGGATWTRPGARFAGGPPLVVDPQVPTTLYSVGGSSLYKSVDGGASWALTYSWIVADTPPPAAALAVAPSDPSTIYLGANDSTHLLQVSHDGGATFQPLPTSGQSTPFPSISALAVDPGDPQTLYVAGPGFVLISPIAFVGTIWKSQDGGQTFTVLSLSIPNGTIDALLIDPANSDVVYAAHQYGFFLGGDVEVSRDAGTTWSELAPGLPGASVLQLVLGPTGTLYAGTDGASVYMLAAAPD